MQIRSSWFTPLKRTLLYHFWRAKRCSFLRVRISKLVSLLLSSSEESYSYLIVVPIVFGSGFSEATTKKLLDIEEISGFLYDSDCSPYKAIQHEAVPFRPLNDNIKYRSFQELPPWIVAATEKVVTKKKKGKKRARSDDEDEEYDAGPDGKLLTVIEIHETT